LRSQANDAAAILIFYFEAKKDFEEFLTAASKIKYY
jgi:hypothetical protein